MLEIFQVLKNLESHIKFIIPFKIVLLKDLVKIKTKPDYLIKMISQLVKVFWIKELD